MVLVVFLSLKDLGYFTRRRPRSTTRGDICLAPVYICRKSAVPCIGLPAICVFGPLGFGGGHSVGGCCGLVHSMGGMLPVSGRVGHTVVRACRCVVALPARGTHRGRVGTMRGDLGRRCAPHVGGLAFTRNGLLVGLMSQRAGSAKCRLMGTFVNPFGTNFCRAFTTLFNTDLGGRCSPVKSSTLARQIVLVMRDKRLWASICSHLTYLQVLGLTFRVVYLSIFSRLEANLLRPRIRFVFRAGSTGIRRPFGVAETNFMAKFSPYGCLFGPFTGDVDAWVCPFRRQFASCCLVLCEDPLVGKRTVVNTDLIFGHATSNCVVVSISPVVKRAIEGAICALNGRRGVRIATAAGRLPYFNPPFIDVFRGRVKDGTNMSGYSE